MYSFPAAWELGTLFLKNSLYSDILWVMGIRSPFENTACYCTFDQSNCFDCTVNVACTMVDAAWIPPRCHVHAFKLMKISNCNDHQWWFWGEKSNSWANPQKRYLVQHPQSFIRACLNQTYRKSPPGVPTVLWQTAYFREEHSWKAIRKREEEHFSFYQFW